MNDLLKEITLTNDSKVEEFTLLDVFFTIWKGRFIVMATTFIFAVASILYSLSLPNIYTASILLAPVGESQSSGLSKLANQFGGLSSLAGINLSGSSSKTELSKNILRSRKFLEDFINKYDLLVPLMAVNGFNLRTQKLEYDFDLYNVENAQWVREVSFPKTAEPSGWESYQKLLELLSINEDKESGLISVTIDYYSPTIAKNWLALIIQELNLTVKNNDKKDAQNSIEYLSTQLQNTELSGMRNIFYQLIEEQTKTIMLAEVTEEYVFRVVDPSNVPDEKSSPKRALMVISATFLGLVFGIFIVFFLTIKKNQGRQNQ